MLNLEVACGGYMRDENWVDANSPRLHSDENPASLQIRGPLSPAAQGDSFAHPG